MIQGDRFETEFVLNEKIQSGFVDLFYDRNPLHTDSRFARSKGFDDVVMQGNILGGFISFFIGECIPIKNVIIHSQDIKYIKPIYMNDVLVLKCEIVDVFESVGVVEFKFLFEKKANALAVAKGRIQVGILK